MIRAVFGRTLAAAGFALLAALPLALPTGMALAVQPDEVLADPSLENRARVLSRDLRCLVCQNQSIDDSNAPLARDLRILVRERLVAGDNDTQVMEFVTDRYGDYVLLKPPFKTTTLFLWIGPFVILGIGAIATAVYLRGRRNGGAATGSDTIPLTEEERHRLDALLRKDKT